MSRQVTRDQLLAINQLLLKDKIDRLSFSFIQKHIATGYLNREAVQRIIEGKEDVKHHMYFRITRKFWDMARDSIPGMEVYENYHTTLPGIPNFPTDYQNRFPHLVLVDLRFSLRTLCKHAEVDPGRRDEEDFRLRHPKHKPHDVHAYWMRCQEGRMHHGKHWEEVVDRFPSDEVPLTYYEGLCLQIQRHVVDNLGMHTMDLPGSVYARDSVSHEQPAYIGIGDRSSTVLRWYSYSQNPKRGVASRGCVTV